MIRLVRFPEQMVKHLGNATRDTDGSFLGHGPIDVERRGDDVIMSLHPVVHAKNFFVEAAKTLGLKVTGFRVAKATAPDGTWSVTFTPPDKSTLHVDQGELHFVLHKPPRPLHREQLSELVREITFNVWPHRRAEFEKRLAIKR